MKKLLFILLLGTSNSEATGAINIYCGTATARLTMTHSGLPHTLVVTRIAHGMGFPMPFPGKQKIVILGTDAYIDPSEDVRFHLRNLFDPNQPISYLIPKLELYELIDGQLVKIAEAQCEAF